MSKNCWKETTPCNFCYKIFVWPHHTRLHLHKKYIAISKIQTLLTNAISLPSLKSLVAPPNFCCLNCAEWFDLIWFDYCTIDSSHELQRAAEHLIDSTKKTFVSWVMNFTVHMLLKGAVTYCDQHFMSNFSLFYFIFILPHMVIMCYRKTANNITVYASKVFLCRMIFQTHWN